MNDDVLLPDDFEPEEAPEENWELEPSTKDNDFIEVIENEEGQTFDMYETDYYNRLSKAARECIDLGYEPEDVEAVMESKFIDFITERDAEEFIAYGGTVDQVSQEAWDLYREKRGTISIKEAVDRTDPFLKGLGEQKQKQRRTKQYKDAFLKGFNSI